MRPEEAQCDADLALVRRIVAGDRGAVRALSERLACVPRVLRSHNARSGGLLDSHELSDLTQDVFLILWRKLGTFNGSSVLPAWAYRIASLEYRNALRRKLRRASRQEREADADDAIPPGRDADRWEYEDVHRGLARIGRDQARVIRLKHFGGHTFAEIAALLATAESTVKDRYYRGVAELRPLLEDRGGSGRT
jgi:RNA polymerase sigma-70 factor (ECF subfamily)